MGSTQPRPSINLECRCGCSLLMEDCPEGTTLSMLQRFADAHLYCGFTAAARDLVITSSAGTIPAE